ncbi:MAG: hypothetical protein ACREIS_13215 [Nitrospiraceae bacterium]
MIPLRELANPNDTSVRLYWAYAAAPAVALEFAHVQLRRNPGTILIEAIYAADITAAGLVDIFTTAIALPAGVAGTTRNRDGRQAAAVTVVNQATNVAKQTDGVASYAPQTVPLGAALTSLLHSESETPGAVMGPLILSGPNGVVIIPQTVNVGITVYFAYRELQ